MASKKKPTTAITHLMAPSGSKTYCGFELKQVASKTNDPDASTCEGCTSKWANVQLQNNMRMIKQEEGTQDKLLKRMEPPLKESIDMSVVTNTDLCGRITADDANIINDMYMVICRLLKAGSGDAKLITDGADVVKRYKEAGR